MGFLPLPRLGLCGTGSAWLPAVSGSLRRQHALRVLGLHLLVCACLSGCAGEREAGTTSPRTTTGATTAATEAASPVTSTTAEETTSLEPGEEASHRHAFWSLKTLVSRLTGRAIRVGGRAVRLDAETLTCWGERRGRPRAGGRVWTHFSCFQPTFPAGQLVGPDALFRVHATGPARFVVTDASFSR
jgi:hypothetical protein